MIAAYSFPPRGRWIAAPWELSPMSERTPPEWQQCWRLLRGPVARRPFKFSGSVNFLLPLCAHYFIVAMMSEALESVHLNFIIMESQEDALPVNVW